MCLVSLRLTIEINSDFTKAFCNDKALATAVIMFLVNVEEIEK